MTPDPTYHPLMAIAGMREGKVGRRRETAVKGRRGRKVEWRGKGGGGGGGVREVREVSGGRDGENMC